MRLINPWHPAPASAHTKSRSLKNQCLLSLEPCAFSWPIFFFKSILFRQRPSCEQSNKERHWLIKDLLQTLTSATTCPIPLLPFPLPTSHSYSTVSLPAIPERSDYPSAEWLPSRLSIDAATSFLLLPFQSSSPQSLLWLRVTCVHRSEISDREYAIASPSTSVILSSPLRMLV